MVVRESVLESPRTPVLHVEQAADAVVFQPVVLKIIEAGPVQREAVVDHSAVGQSANKEKIQSLLHQEYSIESTSPPMAVCHAQIYSS